MTVELMNVTQVAEFFGVSESTIRRRLRERKNGEGSFPIPIFGFGRIARWRRSDIESWSEIEPEVITIETPTQRNRKLETVHNGLSKYKIKVSKNNVLQEG